MGTNFSPLLHTAIYVCTCVHFHGRSEGKSSHASMSYIPFGANCLSKKNESIVYDMPFLEQVTFNRSNCVASNNTSNPHQFLKYDCEIPPSGFVPDNNSDVVMVEKTRKVVTYEERVIRVCCSGFKVINGSCLASPDETGGKNFTAGEIVAINVGGLIAVVFFVSIGVFLWWLLRRNKRRNGSWRNFRKPRQEVSHYMNGGSFDNSGEGSNTEERQHFKKVSKYLSQTLRLKKPNTPGSTKVTSGGSEVPIYLCVEDKLSYSPSTNATLLCDRPVSIVKPLYININDSSLSSNVSPILLYDVPPSAKPLPLDESDIKQISCSKSKDKKNLPCIIDETLVKTRNASLVSKSYESPDITGLTFTQERSPNDVYEDFKN